MPRVVMASLRAYAQKGRREAGCDEAGRGCLAGPVFAAAVILPPRCSLPGLDDSKKLSPARREALRQKIEQQALAWSVAQLSPQEIDRLNILRASLTAMHRALDGLAQQPEFLLIDGNRFIPYPGIPHQCEIKGDGRFRSIAAASILAKSHRDAYMREAALRYPQYGWEKNFGYPTAAHREAIAQYGLSPLHRRSFRQLPGQLPLPFTR